MGACCSTEPTDSAPGDDLDEAPNEPAVWKIGAGALLAGNAMTVGLAISSVEAADNITLFIHIALLASVVITFEFLGWPLLKGAYDGLSEGQINFDAFFVIAILAAVGASLVSMLTSGPVYFEVAAILLVIHGIGRRVGNVRRRRGLAAARDFVPDTSTVHRRTAAGGVDEVEIDDVDCGDQIIVGPGSTIPVDGTVVRGTALVEETEVTGESFTAVRRPGDTVYGSTHSLDGTLEIETTAGVGERLIDRVADSVQQAWNRPSQWQRQAQSVIQWFVPVVLATAVATFVGWTIATDWTTGLFNALAVLLVACPCALGFAVPLAIWMTMGRWAGRGLVAGDGQCVETMSRVDTVIFDKTGTLTEPTPGLIDFTVADDADGDLIRHLVVAVEQHIDHPVAHALSRLERDLPSPCCRPTTTVESTRLVAGLGIEATVHHRGRSHRLQIGSPELVDALDAATGDAAVRELTDRAFEVASARRVVVIIDDRIAALAIIDERPRSCVDEAIDRLRAMDIEVGILTGDRAERARRFDSDFTVARMTPIEKRKHIEELQARGQTVLFVGDGVNDTPAMAVADVAIDVADSAELAGEVSDLHWCGSDMNTIADAIDQAGDAFSIVRFNLGFATIYNVAGLAVAAAGLLHPVVAAVLMMSSSMFVTWKTTIELDPTAHDDNHDIADDGLDIPITTSTPTSNV